MDYCHQMGVVNRQVLCLSLLNSLILSNYICSSFGVKDGQLCSFPFLLCHMTGFTTWCKLAGQFQWFSKCQSRLEIWMIAGQLSNHMQCSFGALMPVIRRDIKLENTLLDGSKRLVKITDFGYAKSNIDSMPISNVGTPNYAGKKFASLNGLSSQNISTLCSVASSGASCFSHTYCCRPDCYLLHDHADFKSCMKLPWQEVNGTVWWQAY